MAREATNRFIQGLFSTPDREVHHNAAYDSTLDYEELQSVGVESKEKGPRRKDNDLYEPTGPLKQRVRQITECSDDLSALSNLPKSYQNLSYLLSTKRMQFVDNTRACLKNRQVSYISKTSPSLLR